MKQSRQSVTNQLYLLRSNINDEIYEVIYNFYAAHPHYDGMIRMYELPPRIIKKQFCDETS